MPACIRKRKSGQLILHKCAIEVRGYRSASVLIVKPVNHISRNCRKFFQYASHHSMNNTELADGEHIAGLRSKAKPFVSLVSGAGKPCAKRVWLVTLLPVLKIADEDVSARLHIQYVKDFGLMSDVTLKTESLALVLQEDRITEWARTLDRIRFVFEKQSNLFLELCHVARRLARHSARQALVKHTFQDRLESLEGFNRKIA